MKPVTFATIVLLLARGGAGAAPGRVAIAWNDPSGERGVVRGMSAAPPWLFETPPIELGADLALRFARGTLYAFSRAEGTIAAIDPDAWSVTRTYDVDSAGRLEDIAIAGGDVAYVTRAGATHLLRLDLATGATRDAVDLSLFADPDGVPDLGTMAVFEGRLFVEIRRLDSVDLRFIPPAQLAVIDLATEEVVDVDPIASGTQAIELAGTAPKMRMQVIPRSRRLVVGATGVLHDAGGLEMVDLDALESEGLFIREAEGSTGADLGAFVMTRSDRGYLVFTTDLLLSSHLYRFSVEGGVDPPPDLHVSVDYFAPVLIHDPRANALFVPVAGSVAGPTGVHVFDAEAGIRLTGDPLPTDGPPTDLELLCDDPAACGPLRGAMFLRADSNGDGAVDVSDPVFTLIALFGGGRPPECADAADANDDGEIDIADAIFTLQYGFRRGAPPPPPGPTACGPDPTPDRLDCRRHDSCASEEEPAYGLTLIDPPDGEAFATPLGMNDGGIIVGYAGPEPWSPFSRPIRVVLEDTADLSAEWLDVPEPRFGFARDADDEGRVIVGEYDFRPTAWIGRTRVTMAVPDGYFSGAARAVAASGLIVGSFADYDDALPPNPIGPRPCYWPSAENVPILLETLSIDFPLGSADGVNGAGQIAGSLSSPDGYVAVRWDAPDGPPVVIGGLPGAFLSEARGINARGDIAGRSSLPDDRIQAFLARAGEAPRPLPFLPGGGGYSEAFGIDDAGRVVGTARAADGTVHAVLWKDGEVIDLNDSLADVPAGMRYLSSAVALDGSGRIAVEGVLEGGPGDLPRTVGVLAPVASLGGSGGKPRKM